MNTPLFITLKEFRPDLGHEHDVTINATNITHMRGVNLAKGLSGTQIHFQGQRDVLVVADIEQIKRQITALNAKGVVGDTPF